MSGEAETVVLLHGFVGFTWNMNLVQRRLKAQGYRVVNWGYKSHRDTLAQHADAFAAKLRELDKEATAIHIVAHSMGTVVARAALARYRPAKLGRVVLCAPPNRGSTVANWLSPLMGRWLPTMKEMHKGEGSFPSLLPPLEGVTFGVIAARFDHLVALADTHLSGQADHLVVDWIHDVVVCPAALVAIQNFIGKGKFR